ncbi:MAG: hypothetical protein JWL61_2203 [Gemmatimonadetes bacterium]|nr:hypothetical protein [Gemmatimonadota bacterium]
MGRKSKKNRLYSRDQGGELRYYADLRDFADVGGGREAMCPRGSQRATTDDLLAQQLLADRIRELEARRRRKQRGEPLEEAALPGYAAEHLTAKARSGNVTEQWLEAAEAHLLAGIEFFCNGGRPVAKTTDGEPILAGVSTRELSSIGVEEVEKYVAWLSERPNRKGGSLSPSSQRKYLNSLSNLFRRAIGQQRVGVGHNPVSALMDKPQDGEGRGEAGWLEVPDAALLLESARVYRPRREDIAMPFVHPLLASFLLTGGRPSEVLGLEVGDVSFTRRTVTFRPNKWRRLKTGMSHRSVTLWPQLEEILSEYLGSDVAPPTDGLLFPSVKGTGMITDVRKMIDNVAVSVGWKRGEVRPYAFRHTYTAARLQTIDHGAPVAQYTVAKELGHGGDALIKRVYGHLGTVRHRSAHVEYRVEQHQESLAPRLRLIRADAA